MKKIFIIIPIFNEAQVVNTILSELKKNKYRNIIVVDDGSTDNTRQIIHKTGIVYLRHAINRGKGAAIKTGLEAAKILNASGVVTMDGDGQHEISDIPNLLKMLSKNYDVVLGYRSFNKKFMPSVKIFQNIVANLIVWLFYGILVKDSQCGYRAYSAKAIESIQTNSDFYEFDSEVIKEIKNRHLRYAEIKVSTRYTKYSKQKKNKQHPINGVKMIYGMIKSL